MAEISAVSDARLEHFTEALNDCSTIRLISPFISAKAARLIVATSLKSQRIITRFSLNDFYCGVSELAALELLLKEGARIRGLKGLHSKVYLFDSRQLLVTSANLTGGGFSSNLEFGISTTSRDAIQTASIYFDRLWEAASKDLEQSQIDVWKIIVDRERAKRGNPGKTGLPEHEADFPVKPENHPAKGAATSVGLPSKGGPRYFVKLFATGENRESGATSVREAIKRAECHYACTYPRGKRPRSIRHGDVLYIAFLTEDPYGIAIVGRAWGIPHVPKRDDATANEIARREWKSKWPHYIRVFDPVFVDSRLRDAFYLDSIVNRLKVNSFRSTAERAQRGEKGINPNFSLRQQPAVELTLQAAELLEGEFQGLLKQYGAVPEGYLSKLPLPDIAVELNFKR